MYPSILKTFRTTKRVHFKSNLSYWNPLNEVKYFLSYDLEKSLKHVEHSYHAQKDVNEINK